MAEPINGDKALHQIADAFKALANTVSDSQTSEVEVAPFSRACSLISPLFGSLGIAFKFAEMDYVAKVCFFFNLIEIPHHGFVLLVNFSIGFIVILQRVM